MCHIYYNPPKRKIEDDKVLSLLHTQHNKEKLIMIMGCLQALIDKVNFTSK